MIIYTDLHNRTKNYSLPESIINNLQSEFNVTITTNINYDAEIYWGDRLDDNKLLKMPKLKWIHLSKTGFGKFNLPNNVVVTNTPESSDGVAEYAVSGLLYLLRGLDRMTLDRKTFDVNLDKIKPFNEVKCLIVGHGRIGKKVNRLLTALSMEVNFVTKGNDRMSLLDISDYDFIINALPINNKTVDYFNKDIFVKMNKNSYIINVGRGETVNENDLYNALKNKTIRGAFLDVVKDEPINEKNNLLSLDNVFISPHIANALYNSINTQVQAFKNNLNRYKNKLELENII